MYMSDRRDDTQNTSRRANNKQGGNARGDPNKKIFIGGVPRSVSDNEYREYFRSFGELDDCILMRDSSRICRGFGFVTYQEQSAYEDVLQAHLELRGKNLDAKKAVPSSEVKDSKSEVKVFIGGLSSEVDKSQLDDYFSQYGQIVDSIVMMDNVSGKSRGFGFVTFDNADSVEELMKNPKFEFCGKQIQCKRAQPAATMNRLNRTREDGPRYGQRGRGRTGTPSYGVQGLYGAGRFGGGGGYGREQSTTYADNQWPQAPAQNYSQQPAQGGFLDNWVERVDDNRGGYSANQGRYRPY